MNFPLRILALSMVLLTPPVFADAQTVKKSDSVKKAKSAQKSVTKIRKRAKSRKKAKKLGPHAVLQGLDKVTARISTFPAPIGKIVTFGSLRIVARTCRKRPPEEPPESSAYLEIEEVKPGEDAAKLFNGWMFASSPALSSLEHPVYDVWVTDCKNSSKSSSVRSR